VKFIVNSHVQIKIVKSKTDQYRNGDEILLAKIDSVACPYNALQENIRVAKVDINSSQFLFKAMFRSGSSLGLRVTNNLAILEEKMYYCPD
jgi:hypothetical protein